MKILPTTVIISLIFLLSSCGSSDDKERSDKNEETSDFALTGGQKRLWLEKSSRVLRNGEGIRDENEMMEFEELSPEAALDKMLSDSRFTDTVADFTMFYLGLKKSQSLYPSKQNPMSLFQNITRYPQVIEAALSVAEGRDYFDFITAKPRLFASPLTPLFDQEKLEMGVYQFREDSEEFRKEAFSKFIEKLEAFKLTLPEKLSGNNFCNLARNQWDYLYEIGLYEFVEIIRDENFSYDSDICKYVFVIGELVDEEDVLDEKQSTSKTSPLNDGNIISRDVMVKVITKAIEQTKSLLLYAQTLELSVYAPQKITDLKLSHEVFQKVDGDDYVYGAMGWFFDDLTNSSTNFNRKRGSYILKRFFCDDLTPIDIVDDGKMNHSKDKHASDPGCRSCHYKLDPISGFFRYNGSSGSEYSFNEDSDYIFFDDNAQMKLSEYVKNWSDESDNGWNVGFIRSERDTSLNDYTDSENPKLDDLFALLKRAPEVKKCLVKKVFEYALPNQSLDSGYHAQLANEFIEDSKVNSSSALKQTFKKLLLSRSFRHFDPIPGECYDFPEGITEADRPPCAVAHLLEKHCMNCHNNSSPSGGLNLKTWKELETGSFGFEHLDSAGQSIPAGETFARILSRISEPNMDLRMPLNKHIDASELEAIYQWVTKELENTK